MTTSPTPAERAALKVAQAATSTPDASYDLVSAIVFALGSAQLLQSPETAAELEQLRARAAEVSPWQRATDGLNALVDAGIGFHIEPDGHIANPFGDEHIEWDRSAERWRLVLDEDDEPVPYALTEGIAPAVVTSAALAAAEKLRRTLPLSGGERS
ncbi:hypothetical protein [Streptomyces sp. NPDC094472]|uniref:hypothetical protein n=1 Tax=Streptomyces sp. NPDC094472 TaxID=3155080 RepID=UPI0033277759